jgi:hypothetical protein
MKVANFPASHVNPSRHWVVPAPPLTAASSTPLPLEKAGEINVPQPGYLQSMVSVFDLATDRDGASA